MVTTLNTHICDFQRIDPLIPNEIITENLNKASESRALELIKCLVQDLKNKHPQALCIKSTLGSSGFTFLCQISDNSLPNLNEDENKFVLKWVKKEQGEIEKFCSSCLKIYGFITPDIDLINFEDVKEILPFMQGKDNVVECVDESYILIFMKEFQGITLSSMINNFTFDDFSDAEWQDFTFFCGQLAIIDCFMANDDRFVKFTPSNLSEEYDFKSILGINSGNLMISKDRKKYFVIDNSTSCYTKKRKISQNMHTYALDMLFADEKNDSDSNSKFPNNVSSKTSKHSSNSDKDNNLVNKYNAIFQYFSNNNKNFAQAIIGSFTKEFENKQKRKSEIKIPCLKKFESSIIGGIKEGLRQMYQCQLPPQAPFCCNECYCLMGKNLQSLKGVKNDHST